MNFFKEYKNCFLCPRSCGVDRAAASGRIGAGICREGGRLRISHIGPHKGEEPPISGVNGSGTVFFAGCSLRCTYCQNYQISRHGLGRTMKMSDLVREIVKLIQMKRVHNINFVTPDHFFPHIFLLVSVLRRKEFQLPVVFNLSGYQSKSSLKKAEDYVDIYLADYKYGDPDLALQLSKCGDYPQTALEAIAEMVKQKGFLSLDKKEDPGIARKGVLVRHLILPGCVENSIQALTTLFLEFGPQLPLSLMSQYYPVLYHQEVNLNRFLSGAEFDRVYDYALDLGFENLFVQFPEKDQDLREPSARFLPDFSCDDPFHNNC